MSLPASVRIIRVSGNLGAIWLFAGKAAPDWCCLIESAQDESLPPT